MNAAPLPTRSGARDAFVGIDVAFARGKRLPVSVCIRSAGSLEVLALRSSYEKPPAGYGNVEALDERVREGFAEEVLGWLRRLEQQLMLKIRRVAIDAPSDYCCEPSGRRAAERCLDGSGIYCFGTPTEAQFLDKVQQSRKFIEDGGAPSRLPNANQLWMLVGFDLFRVLGAEYECIETYPQAIVRTLACADEHKSTRQGLLRQIEVAAEETGMEPTVLRASLGAMGYGSLHDRLDAFLSAWVASLEEEGREALGTPPLDVIWVPKRNRVEPASR